MNSLVLITIAIIVMYSVAVYFIWRYYQKRLNNEVTRAQKSERLKAVFLANVSHALRTPLNAIIGFSELILKDQPNKLTQEELHEMMTHIHQNGNRLLYFVSQLLELSDYESGMVAFSKIEVNLAELMASYRREALRDTSPNVSILVRTDLSPHCKGTLDTSMMHQLMMHLLHNASQHTTKGTITLEYGRQRNGLEVVITDTGTGLPDKYKDNIFAMLQNEDSMTIEGEAKGLGLSICKSIIDALHGEISITSDEGKGTKARVWFPCRMRDMTKMSV